MTGAMTEGQESVDRFYWSHGPCCAGCDWWRHFNSAAGECLKSPPVSGDERWGIIGLTGHSLPIGAGHILTPREHRCGAFADTFDWTSLPLAYQKRVGIEARRKLEGDG